jgi:hypothetical protein
MGIRTLLASAVVASSMLAGPAAVAEVLDFNFVGAGSYLGIGASWTQPSNPTPIVYGLGSTTIGVTNGSSTLGPFLDVRFYGTSASGGFTPQTFPNVFGVFGPQLFTGTEAAPMFSTGTAMFDGDGKLTVTAAIPEPSTWAMMIAGLAGLGALSETRRRRGFIARRR